MKTLLQINASLFAVRGQSTRLADEFVAAWRASHPGATVLVRDLSRDAVPHLDGARFQAFVTDARQRTPEQSAVVAYSDALIAELRRADVIVLGVPTYNFGIPSTLKAYFDHVARAGVTFRYTDNGPVGLLTDKKAYVFAARGGRYAGTPSETQTPFLRTFLGFVGITDVQFVYAEGLAMGDAARQEGLAQARSATRRLFDGAALAA